LLSSKKQKEKKRKGKEKGKEEEWKHNYGQLAQTEMLQKFNNYFYSILKLIFIGKIKNIQEHLYFLLLSFKSF